MMEVSGSSCISKLGDVHINWLFLLILDLTSFNALETASRTCEKCENINRPAEIVAPMMFMAFIWFFINIQYEYHVSTHRNIM